MTQSIRLGVNIDHVATLRNARGGVHPDPFTIAEAAAAAGADGITIHLREDRRHIRDADASRICAGISLPINLEMAATDEMARIACSLRPHGVCIVPERRSEITTEGGLDVIGHAAELRPIIARLNAAGIVVSLFIDPRPDQLEAAAAIGAAVVELHTGAYANHLGENRLGELRLLAAAAALSVRLGLECHAGHGLTYANVQPVAALPEVRELNIGHYLIGEALLVGPAGQHRANEAADAGGAALRPLQGLAAGPAAVLTLHAVRASGLQPFLAGLSSLEAGFLQAQNFTAAAGSLVLLPGAGGIAGAVLGLGHEMSLFAFGALPAALPAGSVWRLETAGFNYDNATLGFLLGAYSYNRLKPRSRPPACLLAADVSPARDCHRGGHLFCTRFN